MATRQILVVGGTGFLGRRIAEALSRAGENNVRVGGKDEVRVGGACGPPPPVAAPSTDKRATRSFPRRPPRGALRAGRERPKDPEPRSLERSSVTSGSGAGTSKVTVLARGQQIPHGFELLAVDRHDTGAPRAAESERGSPSSSAEGANERAERSGQRISHGFELLAVDRHDAGALRAALADRTFDVVVDNVAFNRDDVETLLDALGGRVGHYVLTSSAAVYAERYTRRPIRETDAELGVRVAVDAPNPFHPRLGHAYGNGKRAAEQALLQAQVPWTVVRPPVILGADDRTRRVWWFVQRLLDGEPLLIPEWRRTDLQVAWTLDVARAMACVAGNPAAFGRTYNVAQAAVFTAESWIEACAAQLGVIPRYAHVADDCPPGYLLPIAGRPFGHMLLDCTAIRYEVGFEPAPESEWLADTVRGCAADPPEQPSAGYEQRSDEVRIARAILDSQQPSEV